MCIQTAIRTYCDLPPHIHACLPPNPNPSLDSHVYIFTLPSSLISTYLHIPIPLYSWVFPLEGMCQCFHQCWNGVTICRAFQWINDQIRENFVWVMHQTTKDFWRQICNNNQWKWVHENRLLKTHLCFIHHFVWILQVNAASSYYILPTCLPYKNKMYLESGDCCQQTIILCGNNLARVSNKSPQTDSLTYEKFVPRIQIRSIVLSRNTLAEKWFVSLIYICSNSYKF